MIVRIDFDVTRPFVVSASIVCGGARFTHGDVFPWEELGIGHLGIIEMWMAGLVDHIEGLVAPPVAKLHPPIVLQPRPQPQPQKRHDRR